MPLRNRLREIRHEIGLGTQLEMAKLLNLRQEKYNRYENQIMQPTLESALQIADKLSKHVDEIFYIESD